MTSQNTLLKPFTLSAAVQLKNRMVMAPMTRAKADNHGGATAAMANYYAKRANAGLIITEGTIIRPDAIGYHNVPGIYTQQQIEKWRVVTDAAHNNGGKIFMQIWHVGRVSHPIFLQGQLPISSSATTMQGRVRRADGLYYGQSREATLDEITALIEAYATAAKNAIAAGFDGVEIHGANGYLIDQFLHHDTNHREDRYGGSPENMSRFALEVVAACGQLIGFERLGIRLSPGAYLNEIQGDDRDSQVFAGLLSQLSRLPLAYVHTGNFDDSVPFKELDNQTMTQFIRQHYRGHVIASGGYTIDQACAHLANNECDLVSFGKPFIANPDLVTRVEQNQSIIPYHSDMLDTLQ
jgi:N-ethylmaleimide reductase